MFNRHLNALAWVAHGGDWFSVRFGFELDAVSLSMIEAEQMLVDGVLSPVECDKIRRILDCELSVLRVAGKNGKIPLDKIDLVRTAIAAVDVAVVSGAAKKALGLFEE